jgi:hypothetical protein
MGAEVILSLSKDRRSQPNGIQVVNINHHACVMNYPPSCLGETQFGSSAGGFSEKETGCAFLRSIFKENGRVTHDASSSGAWRASSDFGQAGNDPRQA